MYYHESQMILMKQNTFHSFFHHFISELENIANIKKEKIC